MTGSSARSGIVRWLRAGYPSGVPERDYLPLFALLRRRLTNDEVAAVAAELSGRTDPAGREAICELIERLTHETAHDADVERVRQQLGASSADDDPPGGGPPAA
ncbi:DUF3349 domain-containing protein [Nakamurella endophytica]|uniref:DUF3349 domain-containing protein n=1 Tax=Nakamurella endophytica TaxID=1748367 RepID=A0A917TB37_9ACTN|nr:DUF3349 domain-containing protein [Nakamurella endophytica]GGM14137.1 hypothetical protein GCM10011594_37690 [Nakamurella endophytica]